MTLENQENMNVCEICGHLDWTIIIVDKLEMEFTVHIKMDH